jgi:amino acid transporter
MATQAFDAPAAMGAQTLERRAVGLPTAIGTTFSLITAGGVLVSVGQGFAASWVFLAALAIGLLTMYLQSMSFSELATMIPKAGSMNEYVRAGLGPFFATMCVLVGYVAIQVFPGSTEGLFLGVVINGFLGGGLSIKGWVWICVGFIAIVNILGIRPFAALEVFLTFSVAASLLIFGIVGLAGGGSGEPIGGVPDIPFTWGLLSTLLGLAIFTFVGVEYTCPLAEELKRPNRDIPWGIFIGLTLVAIPLVLYGLAATRFLPPDALGDPTQITSMNVGIAIFGEAGKWWMGLIMIGAGLGTLNAVIAGVPRILYGMALTRQLPSPFGYLLPTTRAPVLGIVVMALIATLMNQFEATTSSTFIELILAGVLGWATAYFLINLSVVSLRLREPNVERPYRSPYFPLPQFLASALLALAAFKIFPDPTVRDHIYRDYGIFLAVAVGFSLLYNLYAFRSLKAIFTPVPLAEVYRETELIEEELPLPVEPGLPHPTHPDLPFHHDDEKGSGPDGS